MSINVAVIGFGMALNQRQYHCNAIKTTKGLSLYAMCDYEATRREEFERDYPDVKTFSHFDRVLDDDKVDLVAIATPNNTHAPFAIKALNAGKHVVTEKIMCLNTQEADAMIEASRRNKRLLSVRQNRRWDTDYLTVKKAIESGILGDIFSIDSSLNSFIRPQGWRAQKVCGGGQLYDWGCHLLDQIVQLTQSAPESVFAILEHRLWDVDVDTHTRVLTKFSSGLVSEVEVSNISWFCRPRWHVRGEKGAMIYEGDKARLKTADGETIFPNVIRNPREFYQNISEVLNNGTELIAKPEEVRTSIAIIEAAFISAQRGEVIKLSGTPLVPLVS